MQGVEFLLWFLAAYGFLTLVVSLWHDLTNKRSWMIAVFISDPNKAEGELRALLSELPAYKNAPSKVLLIWRDKDKWLKPQIKKEFSGVEVEEYIGERTLEDVFGEKDCGRIVVIDC